MKTQIIVTALILSIALFSTSFNPAIPSPFGDGYMCADRKEGLMCWQPGDYNPRYMVDPQGIKHSLRWF